MNKNRRQAISLEHEKTTLTSSDWEMFFGLLNDPPAPTARMKKAAEKYQSIVQQHAA